MKKSFYKKAIGALGMTAVMALFSGKTDAQTLSAAEREEILQRIETMDPERRAQFRQEAAALIAERAVMEILRNSKNTSGRISEQDWRRIQEYLAPLTRAQRDVIRQRVDEFIIRPIQERIAEYEEKIRIYDARARQQEELRRQRSGQATTHDDLEVWFNEGIERKRQRLDQQSQSQRR